jgi:hypothetical protein
MLKTGDLRDSERQQMQNSLMARKLAVILATFVCRLHTAQNNFTLSQVGLLLLLAINIRLNIQCTMKTHANLHATLLLPQCPVPKPCGKA